MKRIITSTPIMLVALLATSIGSTQDTEEESASEVTFSVKEPCFYEDKKYSHGSFICQEVRRMRCDDGQWRSKSGNCRGLELEATHESADEEVSAEDDE